MFKIYPYKAGSESVAKLKEYLDAKVIKLKNSRYRYKTTDTIINWGNSRRPSWMSSDVPVLNQPEDVAIASNKLLTLQKLEGEGVPTVYFTPDIDLAQRWLMDGNTVFVRHSLNGHSGEGIEVIKPKEDSDDLLNISERLFNLGYEYIAGLVDDEIVETILPDAPLYTRGINNHGEYRVHVFDGEVILYQKKSRRVNDDGDVITADGEEADVRNLASNWVYRTGNLRRLERIENLAKDAVRAVGLDFGAVDIIKDENGDVFVLEVNSAPGLGNQETLGAYINSFNRKST